MASKKYGIGIGHLLLGWGLHKGCSVLPRSSKPERVEHNFAIPFGSRLDEAIDAMDVLVVEDGNESEVQR